eukprot:gnl/TRDRNA2_/TRDRNA2_40544_c0_seq1.p1 gnl/TRDRNA2_/TRDRNA2_40544_c0~~gnl/TRDRNA2_/TRDRNA2_40544_c0_seq1.p1  ORF type:complete len:252 (-),score=51.09 gnl/TRDRNA2_/TRDRNA2_40544_c0_seq1:104-859(-)
MSSPERTLHSQRSGMLLLPRIDEPSLRTGSLSPRKHKEVEKSSQTLNFCFHLGGSFNSDLADIDLVRRKKLTKIREACRLPGDPPIEDPEVTLKKKREEARRRKHGARNVDKALAPQRSTQHYNGIDMMSLSQAGSWLDSRAFARGVANEAELDVTARRELKRRGRGDLSEGERFVLKRCKDVLTRRYGTLQHAFKKLDANQFSEMSMHDFCMITKDFLRKSESELIYRLLENNCDSVVTLYEFQSHLEEV